MDKINIVDIYFPDDTSKGRQRPDDDCGGSFEKGNMSGNRRR